MTEEEIRFQKRLTDLAGRCESSGCYTCTGFLTLAEQDIFYKTFPGLPETDFLLWGGFEEAERKVLRFGSYEKLWYEEEFPVCCIVIRPVMKKFAEKLSHRDILGALMNLGIERNLLGDIIIKEDVYYVLCLKRIAEYLVGSLKKIKHTVVEAVLSEKMPEGASPEIQILNPTVSSLRADGMISKVFHMSRNESENMFAKGLVYINGKEAPKGSVCLKEGDAVSVRGFGKFRFSGVIRETAKGNFSIRIEKYV